jgi:hypothetical protein
MIGLVLFGGANVYSYHAAVPPCCDGYASFGFPFSLGTFGGYAGYTNFDLTGMIGNGIIGVCASFVFALLFAKALPPIFSSVAQLTSWHARTRL